MLGAAGALVFSKGMESKGLTEVSPIDSMLMEEEADF